MFCSEAADRLTAMDGVTYTYDNKGNLLSGGVYSYTYDVTDRLVLSEAEGLAQVTGGSFTSE